MKIVKAVGAGLLGYLVYAIGSMLLVGLVVSNSTTLGVIIAVIGLPVVGFLAGKLIGLVDAIHMTMIGYIVAGLVLFATLVNIVQNLGSEPIWYKIGTIVLVIPAMLIATRRKASQQESPQEGAV